MTPTLNWKEIARLAETIGPEIQGLFVERVVIPERKNFAEGHLRHEWVLRLTGKRSESALFMSLRPRHPYLAYCPDKGPKAATGATHSPFSLNLSKHLKGAKILSLEALERERILVMWLTAEGISSSRERLGLVICLIPAVPEALLVKVPAAQADATAALGAIHWPILARSRTFKTPTSAEFAPPSGAQAPEAPPVREKLLSTPHSYFEAIQRELEAEAFEGRLREATKALRDLVKQSRERLRQSETAAREAGREPDWQRFGELLKATLHELPEPGPDGARELTDHATGEQVRVPGDPRLEPRQQIEKFFALSKRKARRAQEAGLRIKTFKENIARWERALERPPAAGAWDELESMERLARVGPSAAAKAVGESGNKGKTSSWLGKSFVSRDGLVILAGRSKDENLELTFKHARGNDVWLHVRGKPGAHVVIPLSSGKSAPLETLLDAATLAIHYSGGDNWGKTEVDYTFKKYVKRIKDSTEASYTGNKTLIVEVDLRRLKRLLGGAHE